MFIERGVCLYNPEYNRNYLINRLISHTNNGKTFFDFIYFKSLNGKTLT